jgi:lipopolysaccharide/colanic/teichoic acid biosynthesis glycosyltransferase
MSAGNADAVGLAVTRTAVAEAESKWTIVACRALDIVLAVVMLIALVPVLIAIAIAIRLDSPGRTLFRQPRVGRDLTPFTLNKFRTMRDGAGQETHRLFVLGLIAGEAPTGEVATPVFKMTEDERVTRVGRVLRRSSLDELPQLWNVLRGEMSLVGPRPPIAYEVDHYPAHWFVRFAVKPGMTGLWQVSGRCQLTLEEMIRLDTHYVHRRSLWLNLCILVRTIPAVLHDAVEPPCRVGAAAVYGAAV